MRGTREIKYVQHACLGVNDQAVCWVVAHSGVDEHLGVSEQLGVVKEA